GRNDCIAWRNDQNPRSTAAVEKVAATSIHNSALRGALLLRRFFDLALIFAKHFGFPGRLQRVQLDSGWLQPFN
ncbi:MAG: hypothetical protein ACM3NN_13665, partial [Nitrospirota bacterium]